MDKEISEIDRRLKSLMTWMNTEIMMTTMMNVSYMPGKSRDYREGRARAIKDVSAWLGLLMLECGIDLRKTEGELNEDSDIVV